MGRSDSRKTSRVRPALIRSAAAVLLASLILAFGIAQTSAAESAYSITGVVRLGQVAAPAGAGEVRVRVGDTAVVTDASGHYSVRGLAPGTYFLEFDYLGTGSFADQVWPGGPLRTDASRIGLTQDVVRDIILPDAASLRGVVTDSAGAPVAGAHVIAQTVIAWQGIGAQKRIYGDLTTGADGVFHFDRLAPGSVEVSFEATGRIGTFIGDPARKDLGTATFAPGEDRNLDAALYRSASITGRINCDNCLEHSENTYAVIDRNTGTQSKPVWTPIHPSGGAAEASPLAFEMSALMPGEYRLRAQNLVDGAPYPHEVRVIVAEGQDVHSDIAFRALVQWDRDLTGVGTDVVVITRTGQLRAYPFIGNAFRTPKVIGSGWQSMNDVSMVEDFDGAGHADLLARDGTGRLWLYPGNGHGGFGARKAVGVGWQGFTAIFSPGDFSGDGNADILARDSAGGLWMYPGNGRGGFAPRIKVGSGWQGFTQIVGAGDVDRSGTLDVLAIEKSGKAWIYRGSGKGGWLPRVSALDGSLWKTDAAVVTGDSDGDGYPELLARRVDGVLSHYEATSAGRFEYALDPVRGTNTVGTGWSGLRFVD